MRSAIRAAMATPWIVRLASRGRSTGLDAALDRQVAAALEYVRVARVPPLESMEPAAARIHAERNLGASEVDPEPMAEVIDTTVGDDRVPVRIYVPYDASENWLVWYHGGGGVIGSIAGSEPIVRYIAAHTHCTVASVGYRLGPEDRHPTAIDDAFAAWQGLVERVPNGRVAVGGDSFGGYLAVNVDRLARDAGVRAPDLQVLAYPLLDLTLTSPSIERYADGYLLTKSMMVWFRANYLSASDDQKAVSPWFWPNVEGAAPAIVVTAGYDPLVDEGDAWAQRLREAGVTVRHHRYDSLIHGFLSLAGVVRSARAAVDELCGDMVDMLAG